MLSVNLIKNNYWKWDHNCYPVINEMKKVVLPSSYDANIDSTSMSGMLTKDECSYVILNNTVQYVNAGSYYSNGYARHFHGSDIAMTWGTYNSTSQNIEAVIPDTHSVDNTYSPEAIVRVRINGTVYQAVLRTSLSEVNSHRMFSVDISNNVFAESIENGEFYSTKIDNIDLYSPETSFISTTQSNRITLNVSHYIEDGQRINLAPTQYEEVTYGNSTAYAFKIDGIIPANISDVEYEGGGSIVGIDIFNGIIYGDTIGNILYSHNINIPIYYKLSKSFVNKRIINQVIEPNKQYVLGEL